ncbi:MAG: hypothetical protein HYX63_01400 [Gammaproteobacteria bacterium]|nr:hypothetical protein [Gammaproteobacteria bacterium]
MTTTALEAIENGLFNLETLRKIYPGLQSHPFCLIAIEQIKNGLTALRNDVDPNAIIQEEIGSEVKLAPTSEREQFEKAIAELWHLKPDTKCFERREDGNYLDFESHTNAAWQGWCLAKGIKVDP